MNLQDLEELKKRRKIHSSDYKHERHIPRQFRKLLDVICWKCKAAMPRVSHCPKCKQQRRRNK